MNDIRDDVARVFELETELQDLVEQLPVINFPSWLPLMPTNGLVLRCFKQLLSACFSWKYHFILVTGDDGIPIDRDYYDDMAGIRIHNGYTCLWFESMMPIMEYLREIAWCYNTTVNQMVADGLVPFYYLDYEEGAVVMYRKYGSYLYIVGRAIDTKTDFFPTKIVRAYELGVLRARHLVTIVRDETVTVLTIREYVKNYLREQYHDQVN